MRTCFSRAACCDGMMRAACRRFGGGSLSFAQSATRLKSASKLGAVDTLTQLIVRGLTNEAPKALCAGYALRYKRRLMTKLLSAWYKALIAWYISALKTGGYAVVALMMAFESSVLPLPSEVVIPPAAH